MNDSNVPLPKLIWEYRMSANGKADLQNSSLKGGNVLPPQPVDATHALNLSASFAATFVP